MGDGKALARKDTIGATITERADVHVRSGKTAEGGGPILDPAATVASVGERVSLEAIERTFPRLARGFLSWCAQLPPATKRFSRVDPHHKRNFGCGWFLSTIHTT